MDLFVYAAKLHFMFNINSSLSLLTMQVFSILGMENGKQSVYFSELYSVRERFCDSMVNIFYVPLIVSKDIWNQIETPNIGGEF